MEKCQRRHHHQEKRQILHAVFFGRDGKFTNCDCDGHHASLEQQQLEWASRAVRETRHAHEVGKIGGVGGTVRRWFVSKAERMVRQDLWARIEVQGEEWDRMTSLWASERVREDNETGFACLLTSMKSTMCSCLWRHFLMKSQISRMNCLRAGHKLNPFPRIWFDWTVCRNKTCLDPIFSIEENPAPSSKSCGILPFLCHSDCDGVDCHGHSPTELEGATKFP